MANDVKITVTESGGRKRASSAPPGSPRSYSRAVRVGSTIAITGTSGERRRHVPQDDRRADAPRAPDHQAAIEALGGRIDDVVHRTRMFVTDISQWEAVGAVHGEIFGSIRPRRRWSKIAKLRSTRRTFVEVAPDAIVG
jgi:enamine deaminase RidA (YjgF/YER057c/UK114 family)